VVDRLEEEKSALTLRVWAKILGVFGVWGVVEKKISECKGSKNLGFGR